MNCICDADTVKQGECVLEMDKKTAEAAIEAILFTMGESVEITRLSEALAIEKEEVLNIITDLKEQYDKENRGITIIELENSVQMCTKAEMYEYLIKIAKTPKKMVLSETVLETLSIVAYKQPVTRLEIENIRGVSCDYQMNKLLEYELIQELGRKDAPGRPLLFGTTEQFLRCFGVKSLEELPVVKPEQMEEFKMEAEEEAQLKLEV